MNGQLRVSRLRDVGSTVPLKDPLPTFIDQTSSIKIKRSSSAFGRRSFSSSKAGSQVVIRAIKRDQGKALGSFHDEIQSKKRPGG